MQCFRFAVANNVGLPGASLMPWQRKFISVGELAGRRRGRSSAYEPRRMGRYYHGQQQRLAARTGRAVWVIVIDIEGSEEHPPL
jgi:hypothetical protein